jgi:YVTN family beta-propeller protein
VHREVAALVLFAFAAPAWAATGTPPAAPPVGGRATVQGIAVELQVEPVAVEGPARPLREGDSAAFRFRVADPATGNPVAGAFPNAWLEMLREGESATDRCAPKVEKFIAGDLFSKPAADLNVYYVLALNQDATISVVDPLFGFGGTKLLAMVELGSPGEDWALSPDGGRLFVSLPAAGAVAVVDTATWKVTAKVAVGLHPRRLALQPDGALLWVGLDGPGEGSGVAAVRTADLTVAARIPTGEGPHDLALDSDRRLAFVTNGAAGTLSIVDAGTLAKTADVALGAPPTAVAYSPLAGTVYVVSEEQGTIIAVDAGRRLVLARIAGAPGLKALRLAPGGRLAFIPNPRTGKVHILDTASNRIVQSADVDHGPEEIDFSENLAYVRRHDSEVVLMIPLDQVGVEGRQVPVVDFPAGQRPFGQGAPLTPSASIVRAPGATAVLVANPADRTIYYYKEGMAAPVGSFSNYDRQPRAVLVVDRSLKERAPGNYETLARLDRAGRYRVAFFLDAPRTVRCFELSVAVSPELEAKRRRERPIAVEPLLAERTAVAGRPLRLRFRLADPNDGKPVSGLDDVNVMLFQFPGNWQERRWGRQVGDGIYEVEVVPPQPGEYRAAVECRSGRLLFHQSPQVDIAVLPARPAS